MFFSNLTVYRIRSSVNLSLDILNEQLARNPFRECPSHEPRVAGWIPAESGEYIRRTDGAAFIVLGIQSKLMPAAAVNEEVKKRAAKLEDEQGFRVGRKAMKELKERVIQEMLPTALKKTERIHVVMDLRDGWMMIDSATGSKAEAVIEQLRLCLDDLPLAIIRTTLQPSSAMAYWLTGGEAPAGFTIDRDCQLKSIAEEKATVTYARQPLDSVQVEIRDHLSAGKMPTRLAMTWDDRLSFVLTDAMALRRLHFLDLIKEQAEQNAECAAEQDEADRAIMLGELRRLLPAIVDALFGEVAE